MAIATANARVAHRDMGGATPDAGIGGPAPSPMTAGNPNISGYLQRLQAMSPDQLRVLAMRSGGSQMGQMAQQVLQRKLVMPNAGGAAAPAQAMPAQGLGAPPQVSSAPPQAPAAPYASGMMARGGHVRGYADGGMPSTPWFVRSEARGATGSQYYGGSTPGRADLVNDTPPAGSYVLPADVVSGHGEGNSEAGARAIEEALSTGPHGVPLRGENVMPVRGRGLPPPPHDPRLFNLEARGGSTGNVPVKVSHGEMLIGPDKVREIGGGSLKAGHHILDLFVKESRKKNIAELKTLPGPART